MKTKNILVRILTALVLAAATQLSAEAGLPTIELVTSFGPSVFGSEIFAQSINSNGDIAGYIRDINQADDPEQGFVRLRNGTYSIIVHPDEEPGTTTVSGINDSRLIAGDYISTQRKQLGFLLSGDTYTDVLIPGALSTEIDALNNAGNFAGMAAFPSDFFQPYISVGGNIALFSVPGVRPPFITYVGGMNNLNQVVGNYSSEGGNHGYIRDADGTMTFPIDYPGALHTFLYGINDKGWIVGSYIDSAGVYHGFFLTLPIRFVAFDPPGSTFTQLSGINNQGIICGDYAQNFGVVYGLVARATLPPAD